MTSFLFRRKRMRSLRYRTNRRNTIHVVIVVVVTGAILYLLKSTFNRPRGCGRVQIWSHRGHLDSSAPESRDWSCDHVLSTLASNGIHHFDVDVIFYEGQSIVAHPTEMGHNLGSFSPSPCSKIPLKIFIQKLKHHYGSHKFFVTLEPKSAWTDDGDFLSPPQEVIGGILDVLETEPINNRCGIILQSWQLKDGRVTPLEYRMKQHCKIAVPLKRTDTPLTRNSFPSPSSELLMPTIELFGGPDGDWFLQQTLLQRNVHVILWIIDTMETLKWSLRMKGVHGVISNHPIRLKRMYQDVCKGTYDESVKW